MLDGQVAELMQVTLDSGPPVTILYVNHSPIDMIKLPNEQVRIA